MCAIDWGFVAAWVGALATAGLLIAAIYGWDVWKSQFIKTLDRHLALRILNAISNSHIVFHELRTPDALFSDGDVQVEPPEAHGPDPHHEYRKMFARYEARTMHLATVRMERTALLLEATALWEGENYANRLVELNHLLGSIENSVTGEVVKYINSLRPDLEDDTVEFDRNILYSPLIAEMPDPTDDQYQTAKNNILDHLRPKIRME